MSSFVFVVIYSPVISFLTVQRVSHCSTWNKRKKRNKICFGFLWLAQKLLALFSQKKFFGAAAPSPAPPFALRALGAQPQTPHKKSLLAQAVGLGCWARLGAAEDYGALGKLWSDFQRFVDIPPAKFVTV